MDKEDNFSDEEIDDIEEDEDYEDDEEDEDDEDDEEDEETNIDAENNTLLDDIKIDEDYEDIDGNNDKIDDTIKNDDYDIIETEINKNKKKIVKKVKQYSNPPLAKINTVLDTSNRSANIIIVPDSDRITSDFLDQREISQLLSIRATHIAKYGRPEYLTDIKELQNKINISSRDIAKLELKHRMIPVLLKRFIGKINNDEYYEIWDPNTMNITNIF